MYKQVTSPAIVIARVNFNEVDRIVTFVTPNGQVSAMVKGVRKVKSRLAGGIELFSISRITYLDTRSDLKRLVQSELVEHYGEIAGSLERMLFGYDCMKQMRRICPEETEDQGYYLSLKALLSALNNLKIDLVIIKVWWQVIMLDLSGQRLELYKDDQLKRLFEGQDYAFAAGSARLTAKDGGSVNSDVIKILRLMQEGKDLGTIAKLKGASDLLRDVAKDLEPISKDILD
jgi:DNA repair protein RecO (recombination protein O)